MQDIPARFARYVVHRWPDSSEVEADELSRIHGGASRETYRLRLRLTRDGRRDERRLILRRDPTGSLIESVRMALPTGE